MPSPTVYAPSNVTLGGLSLSARDPVTGVEIVTEDVGGWGSPAATGESTQKPRGHGGWSGESFLRPRSITLTGYIYADDPSVLSTGVDTLIAACSLGLTTLAVSENGRTRTCQVRRQDEPLFNWVSANHAEWSLQLIADDPRKYGSTVGVSTPLASTTGGFTLPFTLPLAITATTATGLLSITNTGNIKSPITLRIDGPVQGPAVTHIFGSEVTVWASSATVVAGNWLTVVMDDDKRYVLENDQASRNDTVTQRGWFFLEPGVNQFVFTANAYNSSALLTVTTDSAWM